MRLGVAGALVVLSMAVAWAGGAQPYVSPTGHYRVVFPAGTRPVEVPQKQQSSHGELQGIMCMVLTRDVACCATHCDYPAGTMDRLDDPTPVMEMAAEYMAQRIEGRVEGKSPFTLRGNKGLSVSFSGRHHGSPVVGQANLLLVRNRLHMVYAMAPKGPMLLTPEVRAFFASFDLM